MSTAQQLPGFARRQENRFAPLSLVTFVIVGVKTESETVDLIHGRGGLSTRPPERQHSLRHLPHPGLLSRSDLRNSAGATVKLWSFLHERPVPGRSCTEMTTAVTFPQHLFAIELPDQPGLEP